MQQDSEIGRDVLDVGGVGAVVGQQVGGFGGIGAQIVELPLGPRRRDERATATPDGLSSMSQGRSSSGRDA